jgi:hypothetical protein
MKNKRLKVLSNREVLARPFRSYAFESIEARITGRISKMIEEALGVGVVPDSRIKIKDLRERIRRLTELQPTARQMIKGLSIITRYGTPILKKNRGVNLCDKI